MQASIRKKDGIVIQYGISLGLMDECDTVELTAKQEKDIREAILAHKNNIVLKSDGTITALPAVEPAPQPPDQITILKTQVDQLTAALIKKGTLTKADTDPIQKI